MKGLGFFQASGPGFRAPGLCWVSGWFRIKGSYSGLGLNSG